MAYCSSSNPLPTVRLVSVCETINVMMMRTGRVEILIDNVTLRSPHYVGADFGDLLVQPVSEIRRVTGWIKIKDVVDVIRARERAEDVGIAVILSLATIRIFSGACTLEDLNLSQ